MREHARCNTIWDEGQLGAVEGGEGVLGMVDQVIIYRCIMEEVKQYHRNLAVAFYDYKKTYNKGIMTGCCECTNGLGYQEK